MTAAQRPVTCVIEWSTGCKDFASQLGCQTASLTNCLLRLSCGRAEGSFLAFEEASPRQSRAKCCCWPLYLLRHAKAGPGIGIHVALQRFLPIELGMRREV